MLRGSRRSSHQARIVAEVPDPDPDLVRVGRHRAGVRRDRSGRPRGRQQLRRVLFHPDDDRHRDRLDREPVRPEQGRHPRRWPRSSTPSALFPFPILGIDSDNGSEFINAHLFDYCTADKITFTRSRPGNKNDGAHVEQKNWTHVRSLVGYLRYDTPAELESAQPDLGARPAVHEPVLRPTEADLTRTGRREGHQTPRPRPDPAPTSHSPPGVLTPAQKAGAHPGPQPAPPRPAPTPHRPALRRARTTSL